jgi:hypothetical protein
MSNNPKIKIEDNLRPQYVAFIDVLGFSEMVNSSEFERINIYFNTVEKAFEKFDLLKGGIKKLAISDSIILIADDTEESFALLLTAVQSLQTYLAHNQIWVRGAISFGEVWYEHTEKGDILVGKGYIKAYKLEGEAKVPRMIIDPAILVKQNRNRTEFCLKYNCDESGKRKRVKLIHEHSVWSQTKLIGDDAIFVSYADKLFYELVESHDLHILTMIDFSTAFSKSLYSSQAQYEKYLWLKKYFVETLNGICADKKEHGEDESDFLVWAMSFGFL